MHRSHGMLKIRKAATRTSSDQKDVTYVYLFLMKTNPEAAEALYAQAEEDVCKTYGSLQSCWRTYEIIINFITEKKRSFKNSVFFIIICRCSSFSIPTQIITMKVIHIFIVINPSCTTAAFMR